MAAIFQLVIVPLIIGSISAASYNQPNLSVCASWNENATTFANINWVGKQPAGVFVNDENTIYVANREHGRILVWHNRSSTPKMNISGNLTSPWSLFATADGDIYVDNGDSNNRVDRWTLNATVSKLAMKVNGMCTGLFVDINDNLYCSSANDHRVVKIALKSGKTLPSTVAGIGCPGPVPNMLDHPHGIFVDNNLNLYVADTQNNRIQFFAPDQMNAITVAGFGAIVYFILNKPTGVVLDADGYLFIVDSYNHRIVRSMPDDFKCVVGCSGNRGSSSSQLNTPQTMAFDTNGNIFVSDFNNHRIQKFSLTLNPYVSPAAILSNLTYSQQFISGVTPTTQCLAWKSFVAQLIPRSYKKLMIYGSSDPTGVTLTDHCYIANIALALRTSSQYGPVTYNSATWAVTSCGSAYEITIDGTRCTCHNLGRAVRPCIGSYQFGGLNTPTCSGPTQTMTIIFQF